MKQKAQHHTTYIRTDVQRLMVCMFAGHRALGDFSVAMTFATFLKRLLKNAQINLYMNDDRPYKPEVLSLTPAVDLKLIVTGTGIPFEWFDVSNFNPNRGPDSFYANQFPFSDLFIMPHNTLTAYNNKAVPYVRAFRMPEDREEECRIKLINMGLKPGKWIATVFARESTYEYRPGVDPTRSVDPQTYFDLIDYITEDLGGQVVRLGDTNMKPMLKKANVLDLSRIPNSFMLQAYAMQLSRFMISADSGPVNIANGLGVPIGFSDKVSFAPAGLHPKHQIITKNIKPGPNAPKDVDLREMVKVFQWWPIPGKDHILNNTIDELKQLTNVMYEQTDDCRGWREEWIEEDPIEQQSSFTWPLPVRSQHANYLTTPWWEKL